MWRARQFPIATLDAVTLELRVTQTDQRSPLGRLNL